MTHSATVFRGWLTVSITVTSFKPHVCKHFCQIDLENCVLNPKTIKDQTYSQIKREMNNLKLNSSPSNYFTDPHLLCYCCVSARTEIRGEMYIYIYK